MQSCTDMVARALAQELNSGKTLTSLSRRDKEMTLQSTIIEVGLYR
jgi:hypothetical protein